MAAVQNKDTRYFLDIDMKTSRIIGLGYEQKENLARSRQSNPYMHRLFLTKGQFNKLIKRME